MAVTPKNYLAEQLDAFAQYLELQIDHYVEDSYTGVGPLEGRISDEFQSDKLSNNGLGSRKNWEAYSESAIRVIEAAVIQLLATRYQQAGWVNSFQFSIKIQPETNRFWWQLSYDLKFTLRPVADRLDEQQGPLQQPKTVESIDEYLTTIEQGAGKS